MSDAEKRLGRRRELTAATSAFGSIVVVPRSVPILASLGGSAMRLSTRYSFAGIAALALLAVVHQLRSIKRPSQPVADYLIGVLPNFAAAIAITFVLFSIWCDQNPDTDFSRARRAFLVCSSISLAGLLTWESIQKSSARFVFDLHDIGATAIGIAVGALLFNLMWPSKSSHT